MWLLREEETDEWTRVGQLLGGKRMRSWRAAEALRDRRVVCVLYVDLLSTSVSVEKPLNNNEDQRFSDMCVEVQKEPREPQVAAASHNT